MFWMWFWFAFAVGFIVAEVMTVDLICIWFGAAALVLGVLLAIFPTFPIAWQFIVFVVLSAAFVLATRPLAKRFLHNDGARTTNLHRLIGQVAIVTETIDNLDAVGAVRLGGVEWTARTVDGDVIEAGAYVTFEKIEGNKVFVKRKGE